MGGTAGCDSTRLWVTVYEEESSSVPLLSTLRDPAPQSCFGSRF